MALTIQQLLDGAHGAPALTSGTRAILMGLLQVQGAVSTPAVRTAVVSTATGSGAVAAGKRYIEFIFSSDFAGTIDGETFAGGNDASYSLPLLSGGDTYAALNYTITAGNARITAF